MRIPLYILITLVLLSCKESFEEPVIALDGYQIEEGFTLEVLASEPLLKAPLAMDFDNQGRMWVAEMPGYMHNMEGKGENDPTGSIKILEDRDGDGRMDHAKIFLNSLVLPRALALVYDGLLYAEPPNLWFVGIKDDTSGKRVLVDSLYAADGNPEHQPNGLLMNIDNWIYNAKSNYRYQRKKGTWIKEPTTFRGQWGISHDNFGRLYFNDNSRQLLGDHVLPNRLVRNRYFTPEKGVAQLLTEDQRVYPLQPVLVNRGYAPGVLDADSLLVNVTAACSPLVYRGGMFPEEYDENVFVCVPEANVIKRNILSFEGNRTVANQAWEEKEFLASLDEGFRPVSLYNGPDGSIYVVDMHLGVLGHHAYLSPYLKKIAKERQMDTIIDMGRILKIGVEGKVPATIPNLNKLSSTELVELLYSENGWLRDRAQQLLILKGEDGYVSRLHEISLDTEHPISQIHALYTLKGTENTSFEHLAKVASGSSDKVVSHTLVLLEEFVSEKNEQHALELFQDLLSKKESLIDLYLASTLGKWTTVSEKKFLPLVLALSKRYTDDLILKEALVSGLAKNMEAAVTALENDLETKKDTLVTLLNQTLALQKADTPNPIYSDKLLAEDNRTRGAKIFRQICAACHSINGKGSEGLAPPLLKSEYMNAPLERLGLIVLHGLSGPVHVNGKKYEFNQAMPGLIANESLTDEDIADVIAYATSAFSDVPRSLKPETIKNLREVRSESGMEFTEKELNEFVEKNKGKSALQPLF
ncbi:DUF7133 domain-containing protein [Maribacter halichondriae]|uniref:DUF7133 domain-containing protein n=1 Tax=Maribacter halichondriae TaxID=2980554 RepID=UPI002358775E|nr:c-type cytochrome [Maribacter sp. Hal144]